MSVHETIQIDFCYYDTSFNGLKRPIYFERFNSAPGDRVPVVDSLRLMTRCNSYAKVTDQRAADYLRRTGAADVVGVFVGRRLIAGQYIASRTRDNRMDERET
jgi:hypothetical protein